MIEVEYSEAGRITLKEADFAAYAAWFDRVRESTSDAGQNLVIDCASEPNAEGLSALFDDFGFLPEQLCAAILERVGSVGEEGYPVVRLREAREAHAKATELRSTFTAGVSADVTERTSEDLARALATIEGLPTEDLDAAERVSRRAIFFRTPAGILPFRPPPRLAAAAYVDAMSAFQQKKEGASFLGAGRTLMLACFIGDPKVLAASIERYPALVQWIPPVLQEVGGGGKAKAR